MTSSTASRLLGERVRDYREKSGLTQMDLANLAGVNVSNYGNIERGQGNPNFETLIRLAAVLEIDASRLISGIGIEALPEAERPSTAAEFLRWKRSSGSAASGS